MKKGSKLKIREEVFPDDIEKVRSITSSSGFFSMEEIEIAMELVEERLASGGESGYHFIFADINGETAGYSAYGPIPCTKHSYDLYWIAVDYKLRGEKIGTALLDMAEKKIASMGGKRIYVETSSRELYEPTRSFYIKRGYAVEAEIKDFYDRGDSKCIFVKEVQD